MIVVDTSALMAILLFEEHGSVCHQALSHSDETLISAATKAEALIVAGRRDIADAMAGLLRRMDFRVVDLTDAGARRAANAYARWGRGVHPAGLNYGDCFSYALAEEHDCPLLFVGYDFSRTDIRSALA